MPKNDLSSHMDMGDTACNPNYTEVSSLSISKVTQEEYFNYIRID